MSKKAVETPLMVIGDETRRLEEMRATIAGLPDEYREYFAKLLRAVANELSPTGSAAPPSSSAATAPSAESHLERIGSAAPPSSSAATAPSAESHLERIEHYFRSRENRPATLVQIADETGVHYTTVRTFIYKRHTKKFLKVPTKAAGRSVYWSWAELASPEAQGNKNTKDT